ncbi:hypothetical protein [Actinacidiphila sp. bgisy167]|uniref:hypothetical protein n=1 Tax=Actinacidiphila sp. bgisy167 TaxID=3413797 RepID=UPI003D7322CE
MGDVLTGTGTLDPADLTAFMAHVQQAAEVYQDVVTHPPQGMTPEQALRALTRIPSHRLTAGLTRDDRDRLLHTAHRSTPNTADERHLIAETGTQVAHGTGLEIDKSQSNEIEPQHAEEHHIGGGVHGDKNAIQAPQGEAHSSDLTRIRYAEAAASFDARLGRYLILRPQALHAIREVVLTIRSLFEKHAPDRLTTMGHDGKLDGSPRSGDIGTRIADIIEASTSGNLRELVGMLFYVAAQGSLKGFIAPPTYDDFPWLRTERQWRKVADHRTPRKVRAESIFPPLSRREIAAAGGVDDEGTYVVWDRASDFSSLPFQAPLHQDAEATGGLVASGSSGSMLLILESLHRLQAATGRSFDFPEIRLGLIGAMLVGGHHTAHELMRSAALWPRAKHYGFGTYTDGWSRYRNLAPITEEQLRRHVAEDGLFPDEIALGIPYVGVANDRVAASGMDILHALGLSPERWAAELERNEHGVSLPAWQPPSPNSPATRLELWSQFTQTRRRLRITVQQISLTRPLGMDPSTGRAHPNAAGHEWELAVADMQSTLAEWESVNQLMHKAGLKPSTLAERFNRWSNAELAGHNRPSAQPNATEPFIGMAALTLRESEVVSVPPMFTVVEDAHVGSGQTDERMLHDDPEDAAQRESELLAQQIESEFGIRLDSDAGVAAVKETHPQAPEAEKAEVKPLPWTVGELKSLYAAMKNYAPILGSRRAHSSRGSVAQEITVVGHVKTALHENRTYFDAAGEYILSRNVINIYRAAHSGGGSIEAVATHELAHGVLRYALPDFTKKFWEGVEGPWNENSPEHDFQQSITSFLQGSPEFFSKAPRHAHAIEVLQAKWLDVITQKPAESAFAAGRRAAAALKEELPWFIDQVGTWESDRPRLRFPKERPITAYGATNSDEDLAETAKFYFGDNASLRQNAPLRAEFFDRLIHGWAQRTDRLAATDPSDHSRSAVGILDTQKFGSAPAGTQVTETRFVLVDEPNASEVPAATSSTVTGPPATTHSQSRQPATRSDDASSRSSARTSEQPAAPRAFLDNPRGLTDRPQEVSTTGPTAAPQNGSEHLEHPSEQAVIHGVMDSRIGLAYGTGEVRTDRWLPFGSPSRPEVPQAFEFTTAEDGTRSVSRPPASGERTDIGYSWAWYRGSSPINDVLHLTRRIHLRTDGASPEEVRHVQDNLREALDDHVNRHQYRLPALQPDQVTGPVPPGPVLRVSVEFVDDPEAAHSVATLRPGRPLKHGDMRQDVWYVQSHPVAQVHEVVHGLGVRDDQADPRVLLTPGGRAEQVVQEGENSLMGVLTRRDSARFVLTPDHRQQIADVLAPHLHVGQWPELQGTTRDAGSLPVTDRAADHSLVDSDDGSSTEGLDTAPSATGLEVEDQHILVGPEFPKGTVLAEHPLTTVVIDHKAFGRAYDGRLYTTMQDAWRATPKNFSAPVAEIYKIAEFVVKPTRALRQENRVPSEIALTQLETSRNALLETDRRGVPISLEALLTSADGWTVTSAGQKFKVAPSPSGPDHPAYTQLTTGIVSSGLTLLQKKVGQRLMSPDLVTYYEIAEQFGRKVAMLYVSQLLGGFRVKPEEMDLLRSIPEIDEVWGHAWSTFLHVGANPMTSRFFRGGLVKSMLPAASRTPLGVALKSLNPRVQEFFRQNHDNISRYFEAVLKSTIEEYEEKRKLQPSNTSELLREETWSRLPIGDYLTSALLGQTSRGTEVSQSETVGMEDYHDLDTNGDRLTLPLRLVELRNFAFGNAYLSPREVRRATTEVNAISQESYDRALRFPSLTVEQVRALAKRIIESPEAQEFLAIIGALQKFVPPGQGSASKPLVDQYDGFYLGGELGSFAIGYPVSRPVLLQLNALVESAHAAAGRLSGRPHEQLSHIVERGRAVLDKIQRESAARAGAAILPDRDRSVDAAPRMPEGWEILPAQAEGDLQYRGNDDEMDADEPLFGDPEDEQYIHKQDVEQRVADLGNVIEQDETTVEAYRQWTEVVASADNVDSGKTEVIEPFGAHALSATRADDSVADFLGDQVVLVEELPLNDRFEEAVLPQEVPEATVKAVPEQPGHAEKSSPHRLETATGDLVSGSDPLRSQDSGEQVQHGSHLRTGDTSGHAAPRRYQWKPVVPFSKETVAIATGRPGVGLPLEVIRYPARFVAQEIAGMDGEVAETLQATDSPTLEAAVTTATRRAAEAIRQKIAHTPGWGMENTDILVTTPAEGLVVWMTIAQRLANTLDHRVKISIGSEKEKTIEICPQ